MKTKMQRYIEKIENANGTALKFPDGTMMAYKDSNRYDNLIFSDVVAGKMAIINDAWIYPVEFVEPPAIFSTVITGNCTSYRTMRDKARIYEQSVLTMTSSVSVNEVRLSYFAIGKWK